MPARAEQKSQPVDLTHLLNAWASGDSVSGETALATVYADLHRIASRRLANERTDHTLQATALVHEAYLRLADLRAIRWEGRVHFFGSVTQMIRRILVDHARKHRATKRGGGQINQSLDEIRESRIATPNDLLAVHDALSQLEREAPDLARIVLYRFFGGLTNTEIAEMTGRSPATVKRKWRLARAWLYRYLRCQRP